jgi:pimeloyl-ACP methyl ester carboxylesterase
VDIIEHRAEVAGINTFWRQAGNARVLWVHGVPVHSEDWLPFLERCGGVAVDLPGFGRSDKPAEFDYSIDGYRSWLDAFVTHLGWESHGLVVHDWGGGIGLGYAQEWPDRIERLVVINATPLLPGYRWHWIAKVWRTPLVGELFMGTSTRAGFKLISRQANATPGPLPDEFIDYFWKHFDHGTQRAILKLYRSAPPSVLAEAGRRLGELRCPALVLWGDRDPYLPARFADAYGQALGGETTVEVVEGTGHWMWLDKPELVERVCGFLR